MLKSNLIGNYERALIIFNQFSQTLYKTMKWFTRGHYQDEEEELGNLRRYCFLFRWTWRNTTGSVSLDPVGEGERDTSSSSEDVSTKDIRFNRLFGIVPGVAVVSSLIWLDPPGFHQLGPATVSSNSWELSENEFSMLKELSCESEEEDVSNIKGNPFISSSSSLSLSLSVVDSKELHLAFSRSTNKSKKANMLVSSSVERCMSPGGMNWLLGTTRRMKSFENRVLVSISFAATWSSPPTEFGKGDEDQNC